MKKISILLILTFAVTGLFSQITLETSYTGFGDITIQTYHPEYPVFPVNLDGLGYKYVVKDRSNQQVKIYNLNHSLYKTINLSIPAGKSLEDIGLVSNKLFNNSNEIEVIYSFSDCTGNCIWTTQIIDENGTIVSTINGCPYYQIVNLDTDGFKLIAYVGDANTSSKSEIYNLPGSIPCESCGSLTGVYGKLNNSNSLLMSNYPNPAYDKVTIEYNLPTDIIQANLIITNINGQTVKEFKVDHTFDNLEIETNSLGSGTYLYYLEYENTKSNTQKLIISH